MNNVPAKLAAARVHLRRVCPALGVLATFLKLHPARGIMAGRVGTLAVSEQGNVLYNEAYVENLSVELTASALAHEALHPALGVFERSKGLNLLLANRAHDYCVNGIIVKSRLPIGERWLYREAWAKDSFEVIYRRLRDSEPNPSPTTASGNHLPFEGDLEIESAEIDAYCGSAGQTCGQDEKKWGQIWASRLIEAVATHRRETGACFTEAMDEAAARQINERIRAKPSLRQIMPRIIGSLGNACTPSFRAPNRRNAFLPGQAMRAGFKPGQGYCRIVLDTSGSMWATEGRELTVQALALLERLSANSRLMLSLLMADTSLRREYPVAEVRRRLNTGALSAYGGGGSNLCGVFRDIWQRDMAAGEHSAVLVFTDGEIAVPDAPPAFALRNTVWITLPGMRAPTARWGHHVVL